MEILRQKVTGFASPAEDFTESSLDLNHYMVQHPSSTFFMRVSGNRHRHLGVYDGDVLVIDRSLLPRANRTVVATIDGELSLLKLKPMARKIDCFTELWGVVTFVVHKC